MTKNHNLVSWILGCIILIAIVFAVGKTIGQRSMLAAASVQLDGTQAMLAFNRLLDDRHWKSLLEKGCVPQVTKAIDVAEDKDMELLSEYFKGNLDAETIKYIADRDPNLAEQLKTFKSKYGQSWSEEECGKGDGV